MSHEELVDKAAKWLKRHPDNMFVPNCPIIAKELVTMNTTGEIPDIMGWNYCTSVKIEVKTSKADFLRDKKKRYLNYGKGMGEFKYYCCPIGVLSIHDIPDGWGLLCVNNKGKVIHAKKAEKQETNHDSERAMLLSMIRRLTTTNK